jgi:prepilin-type N-terminal cleavage/methylation domain-containing protein
VRARRGFTLIEVAVALTVTGLVAALAYGALRAGADAQARLAERRAAADAALAWRAVLGDAVRHASRGAADDDTVFVVRRGPAPGSDTLRLRTRGVVPPLGAGDEWAAELAPGADGVTLVATPAAGGPAVRVRIADARGVAVAVLPYAGARWGRTWDRPSMAPAAVSVRLLDAAGHALGPPLVARTRPAGEPDEAP